MPLFLLFLVGLLGAGSAHAQALTYAYPPTDTAANATISPTDGVIVSVPGANTPAGTVVTVALSGGTGTLSGTTTQTTHASPTGSGQEATFTGLSVNTPGSYTLTASSAGTTSVAANFTVTAAATTPVTYLDAPTTTAATTTINPTTGVVVHVLNGGTADPGVSVTVTVSYGGRGVPGGGTLGGTKTQTTDTNGNATFSDLTVSKAGYYKLTANPGLGQTVAADFDVTAAPAAGTLTYTDPPTNTVARQTINPTTGVVVQDTGAAAGTPITVSIANGPMSTTPDPTLVGTTTVNTDATGKAVFSGLSNPDDGSYVMTATDTVSGNTVTASFNVTGGPSPPIITYTDPPTTTVVGQAINPTTGIVINVANPTAGQTVTLSKLSGPGNLGGTGVSNNAVTGTVDGSGNVTFTGLTVDTAGNYVLTTTSPNTASVGSGFTATAASTPALTFTDPPTNTAAGATINPTTGVVVNFPGAAAGTAVTVALTGGTGTLSGTATVNTDASGNATFTNLSVNTAGSYTLTASATSATSVAANFTVTAASTPPLTFTDPPTTTVAGATINPTTGVVVNFPGAAAGTAVTVALTGGTGTLGGTLTGTTDASGNVTFSNLTVSTAGSYTLTASATGATSVAANFTVTAATSSLIVTNTNDSGAGSLRAAITQAEMDPAGDTITFASGVTGTITLMSALPTITQNVTITGPGAGVVAVDGGSTSPSTGVRVFDITGGVVAISGLTIQNGNVPSGDGGGVAVAGGATLTLTNDVLSGNSALNGNGGGVVSNGTLTLTDCTLTGNRTQEGGGVYSNGPLTMTGCVLSGNTANNSGGGVDNNGTGTLTSCTFSGNSATVAIDGGILNDGTLTLTDDVLYGDAKGEASSASGTITATHCDFQGGVPTGVTDNGNNLNVDPKFVSATDLHLQAGSPVTGQGTASAPDFRATDHDGVAYASPPSIGAFEAPAATPVITYTAPPANVVAGQPINNPGGIVVNATNVPTGTSVTLTLKSGPGTLGGPNVSNNAVTGATDANGNVTLTGLTVSAPGTYVLETTVPGGTPTDVTFTATPAQVTPVITFTTPPMNVVAGQAINSPGGIVINTTHVPTGTSVTLTLKSGPGTLGGPGVSGNAVTGTTDANGNVTLTGLTVSTAGSYTLEATTAGATPTDVTFTATPAATPAITLTSPPVGVVAGQVINNPGGVVFHVTNLPVGTPVTLTLTGSPGTLSGPGVSNGSVTGTSDGNGNVAFKGLIISAPGSYTLTASATGATPVAVSFTVTAAPQTYVLWNNPDGRTIIWNLADNGGFQVIGNYAPLTDPAGHSGYVAKAISTGPDGVSHVLWSNPDGYVSLWDVQPDGTHADSFYGRFEDDGTTNTIWDPIAVTTDGFGITHLLWTNPNGRTLLWDVTTSDQPGQTGTDPFTVVGNYDAFTDGGTPAPVWKAVSLASGPDGLNHVLFNNADGKTLLWNLDASDDQPANSGAARTASGSTTSTSTTYGVQEDDLTGNTIWKAQSISVSPANQPRIFWNNPDARGILWDVNPDGSFNVAGNYPPALDPSGKGGFTAVSLATRSDDQNYVVFDNPNNETYLSIFLNDGGNGTNDSVMPFFYVPFSDDGSQFTLWKAAAISATQAPHGH